jgi:hypothetical protein
MRKVDIDVMKHDLGLKDQSSGKKVAIFVDIRKAHEK